MPRYRLTIAYDGTDFCGWQKQEPFTHHETLEELVRPGTTGELKLEPQGLIRREGEDRARVQMRTVQHVVEQAVREIVREPVVLQGASRTDAGVHARGQVGAFSCGGTPAHGQSGGVAEWQSGEVAAGESNAGGVEPDAAASGPARVEHPASELPLTLSPSRPLTPSRGGGWPVSRGTSRLIQAVNGRLPADVLIVAAEPVADDFDPISHCTAKGYSYTIHASRTRPLWDRRFVTQVWEPLDAAKMQEAARHFVGEHDFAAFAAAGHGRLSTVRTIYECRVVDLGATGPSSGGAADGTPEDFCNRLRIEVSGNGFLYNMVRIIAGTLTEVGRGRLAPGDIPRIIESKDRRRAGVTLGPEGLCLEWIKYGDGLGEGPGDGS